jgi:outer membrane protein TolC
LQLPEAAPAVPFSEKLVSLALASEPRLKVMEQEIKQAEAMAELTRKLRLPDMSFGRRRKTVSRGWRVSDGDVQTRDLPAMG